MNSAVRHELAIMLAELQSHRLEVILVPCRREVNSGGCIRVCLSRNATWYRSFCARHASGRSRRNAAFDTRIKRANTERVLDRLIAGTTRSSYAAELVTLAERRLARAFHDEPVRQLIAV